MGSVLVEVSGAQAARWAGELHAALAAGPGDSVSPVEVRRSAELVIAVIGLVFAGVATAKTIWDWWSSRRDEGVRVSILLGDGRRVDLSTIGRADLEIVFEQDQSQQG